MGQINKSWLWHRTMSHMNFDNMVKISTKQAMRDRPKIFKPSNTLCKQCQHGKQKRERFKSNEYSTTNPLELIDLYDTTRTERLQGENYFMFLIDDYSRRIGLHF